MALILVFFIPGQRLKEHPQLRTWWSGGRENGIWQNLEMVLKASVQGSSICTPHFIGQSKTRSCLGNEKLQYSHKKTTDTKAIIVTWRSRRIGRNFGFSGERGSIRNFKNHHCSNSLSFEVICYVVMDNCKTFFKTSKILKVVPSRPSQADKRASNDLLYSHTPPEFDEYLTQKWLWIWLLGHWVNLSSDS